MRNPGALALLVLALFLTTGASSTSRPEGKRTLHVDVGGSARSSCSESEPCDSFDRAYRLARPGDVVSIASGTYPSQFIGVDPRKLRVTAPVVFRAAPDAEVVIDGDLVMQGSHAVFDGKRRPGGSYSIRARRVLSGIGASVATTSRHVVFRQLKAETFAVTGTRDIRFEGGDFGPSVACWPRGTTGVGPLGGEITSAMWCPAGSGYETSGNTSGTQPRIGPSGAVKGSWPRNIVLNGITVHDQNSLDHFNVHSGGIFLVSGRGLRIENSLFYGNIVYDLFAQDFTTPECCGMTFGPFRDVTIVNNRFRAPVNAALQLGGNGWTSRVKNELPEIQLDPRSDRPWQNWRIARNSFENGILFGGGSSFRNVSVTANVGGGGNCVPAAAGLRWDGNVMTSSCGRIPVPYGYVLRGGALRPAPAEAAVVRAVFAAAAQGRSLASIARMVKRQGRSHSGSAAAFVRRILRQELYLGRAVGPPGAHPPLVTPPDWRRAQRTIR